MKKKRVLITGGMGFIGSNLARHLADQGAEVTLVDSLIPVYGANRFNLAGYEKRVTFHKGDVRDAKLMRRTVRGQDVLFLMAGQTSHLDSMQDPFSDLENNTVAQLTVLEACRAVNPGARLVFASTRQIYGRPLRLPVTEKHPLRPVDVNGVNKLASEAFLNLYHDVYGFKSVCLRLTNTYGPRMRVKDARQTFLGIWIRLALQKKPFEVWGGRQLRDFTYVDDVVQALVLAATKPQAVGKIYNLGGEATYSLAQVAALLSRLTGSPHKVRPFPARRKRIDIGDYVGSRVLIKKELGWVPKTDLETGLRASLDYYRVHLGRYL